MVNPNREASEDVLRRLKEASYERLRVELKCSIELLIRDFDMTWDDLAKLLKLKRSGIGLREYIGMNSLTLEELNALAHVFSCEPYILFRPREPWTKT